MTAGEAAGERMAGGIPAIDWVLRYRRHWLRPDLLAALTVWSLVVPEGIAYAQFAGLPPQAGLFATIARLVGYALLGTSRQLGEVATMLDRAGLAERIGRTRIHRDLVSKSLKEQ